MAGVQLDINRADFDRVDRALGNAIRGSNGDLMAILADFVLSETQMNFEREQTPDGSAWPKSQRAAETGGKTLQDTRRLRNSYTYIANDLRAEIGTNVIYAAIHHHGGDTGRGHAVTLPSRPALGITLEMQGEMHQLYTDWMGVLFQ